MYSCFSIVKSILLKFPIINYFHFTHRNELVTKLCLLLAFFSLFLASILQRGNMQITDLQSDFPILQYVAI